MKRRYFIYVPGIPFTWATLSTQSLGGSESAGAYLARELVRRGHEVIIFTEDRVGGSFDGVQYVPIGPRTERDPFGENFERAAGAIPHDVLIMQRVQGAFTRPYMSKVRLWWAHDLGQRRAAPNIRAGWWACHGVLAVSAWHAAQLVDAYQLPTEFVRVLPNAVDQELFTAEPDVDRKLRRKLMVYSSRPERGLEHLVNEGGIMERLVASPQNGPSLAVCGYDNVVPHMRGLYQHLWARCRALPNVMLLGALSKPQLARVWRGAWLHVYPTIGAERFEEVSCITAMEAQASGTPCLVRGNGALPETLADGGAIFEPRRIDCLTGPGVQLAQGDPDIPWFVEQIKTLSTDDVRWHELSARARVKGSTYRWADSAARLDGYVDEIVATGQEAGRLVRHLFRMSDVVALRQLSVAGEDECAVKSGPLFNCLDRDETLKRELALYDFTNTPEATEEHYSRIVEYASAEGNHHNLGNDAAALRLDRMQQVLPLIEEISLRGGGRVLDYGCGNAAGLIALARRFPGLSFTGMDLAPFNLSEGGAYLKAEREAGRPVENVALLHSDALNTMPPVDPANDGYDLVLAMEVLEHVPDPAKLADQLEAQLRPGGRFVATFPCGPMESVRYGWFPFREHIHHFEPRDIDELWGAKREMRIDQFSWGEVSPDGESVGGTMVSWRQAPDQQSGQVDYRRKLAQTLPRESLTTCMIVRATEPSLERALRGLRGVTDQLVVAVDAGANPDSAAAKADVARVGGLLDRYEAEWFVGESPLKVGFDAARNATLDRARGDWILWLDADEELEYGLRILKFLQPNCYDAYSLQHCHLTTEPPGMLKMDYPCRLFRRASGMRFVGVVHEHPCYSETLPPKHVMLLPDSIAIMHTGYATEQVRLERFRRNIGLMRRDIETYPKRDLGKFLWIRDLTYLARFGGYASEQSRAYAGSVIGLWRDLVKDNQLRYAVEALPFVTETSVLLHGAQALVRWRFALDVYNGEGGRGEVLEAAFPTHGDARLLTGLLTADRYKPFDQRYY